MARSPVRNTLRLAVTAARRVSAGSRRVALLALCAGAAAHAASGSAPFTVTIVLNGGDPVGSPSQPAPVAQQPPIGHPPGAPSVIPPLAQSPAAVPGSGGASPAPSAPSAAVRAAAPTQPAAIATAVSSICTSASHSQAANAQVRVVCSTGQFASIEPSPGQPFAGSHGGAFRYTFGTSVASLATTVTGADFHIGAGTVTALRVVNLANVETPLEMLVSF